MTSTSWLLGGWLPAGRWKLRHAVAGPVLMASIGAIISPLLALIADWIPGPAQGAVNSAVQLLSLFLVGIVLAYLLQPLSLTRQDLGLLPPRSLKRTALFVIGGYILITLMVWLFEWVYGLDSKASARETFLSMGLGNDRLSALAMVAAVTIGAPLGEEMAFRALAMRGIRDTLARQSWLGKRAGAISVAVAIIASSLLFTAFHDDEVNTFMLTIYFLLAALFAISFQLSGSFYVPVLIHSLNNATAMWNIFSVNDWRTAGSPLAVHALILAAPIICTMALWTVSRMVRRHHD